jgi:hypothetical protein
MGGGVIAAIVMSTIVLVAAVIVGILFALGHPTQKKSSSPSSRGSKSEANGGGGGGGGNITPPNPLTIYRLFWASNSNFTPTSSIVKTTSNVSGNQGIFTTNSGTMFIGRRANLDLNFIVLANIGLVQKQAGTSNSTIAAGGDYVINLVNLFKGAWKPQVPQPTSFVSNGTAGIASGLEVWMNNDVQVNPANIPTIPFFTSDTSNANDVQYDEGAAEFKFGSGWTRLTKVPSQSMTLSCQNGGKSGDLQGTFTSNGALNFSIPSPTEIPVAVAWVVYILKYT